MEIILWLTQMEIILWLTQMEIILWITICILLHERNFLDNYVFLLIT